MKHGYEVGWVERSEAHQNTGLRMVGLAAIDPPYKAELHSFWFNWLKNARGLKKADMLILIGVTSNNLQERDQHVHEFTLPCVRGSGL